MQTSPLVPCRELVAWPRTARGCAVMGLARAHVNAAVRPSAERLIRGVDARHIATAVIGGAPHDGAKRVR
eukprot:4893947-Pyramimonas_sp.AAC.1